MADVTYYVALPFQRDDSGSPVAGAAAVPALRAAQIIGGRRICPLDSMRTK